MKLKLLIKTQNKSQGRVGIYSFQFTGLSIFNIEELRQYVYAGICHC